MRSAASPRARPSSGGPTGTGPWKSGPMGAPCGCAAMIAGAPSPYTDEHQGIFMPYRSAVRTIEAFILEQERKHPEATGELTNLLYDIALGTKVVGAAIRRAGLMDILGKAGEINVQGEEQMKLDVFANESMKSALHQAGRVCVMASEEDDEPTLLAETDGARYAVLIDPLDGSSNIDVNGAVGTIFSIYRRVSTGKPCV